MKFAVCSLLLLITCFGTACTRHQGPVERAGERVDEVIDNVSEGEAPLKKKGPLERAGESIDDTLDGDRR